MTILKTESSEDTSPKNNPSFPKNANATTDQYEEPPVIPPFPDDATAIPAQCEKPPAIPIEIEETEVFSEPTEIPPDMFHFKLNERGRGVESEGNQTLDLNFDKLTSSSRTWLGENEEFLEIIVLHSIFHDSGWRNVFLGLPISHEVFSSEEKSLVMSALIIANEIYREIGQTIAFPPSPEFLQIHVKSAASQMVLDDEEVEGAMAIVKQLQDPKLSVHYSLIQHFFVTWYMTRNLKYASREINRWAVIDYRNLMDGLQNLLDSLWNTAPGNGPLKFDFDTRLEPPEPTLKLGENAISTPGNISNIQAPPKAAKTSIVGAILASIIKDSGTSADTLGFVTSSPGERAVLHFDTEQSPFDHDKVIRGKKHAGHVLRRTR